jgi:hypothetical protein
MSRKHQLVVILLTTLAITASVNHVAARTLTIYTQAVTPLSFGATNQPVDTVGVLLPARVTFLGVAASDLNENYVSDFRGDTVPPRQALTETSVTSASTWSIVFGHASFRVRQGWLAS